MELESTPPADAIRAFAIVYDSRFARTPARMADTRARNELLAFGVAVNDPADLWPVWYKRFIAKNPRMMQKWEEVEHGNETAAVSSADGTAAGTSATDQYDTEAKTHETGTRDKKIDMFAMGDLGAILDSLAAVAPAGRSITGVHAPGALRAAAIGAHMGRRGDAQPVDADQLVALAVDDGGA